MIENSKIRLFLSNPLIKNTLKLSSSSAVLMFLPLVVTPILSRLYSPEEYAIWGIFSSVLFIINSFIFLSYENTIIKLNSDKEISSLISLCVFIASSICIIVCLIFFIGRLFEISFFTEFPPISCLFLAIVSYSAFTLFSCIANREELYGRMSVANLINGISQAGLRILLGVFPIVSFGLVYGNVSAYILADLYLLILLLSKSDILFKKASISQIVGVAKKYQKFPKYDAPARLIEFTAGNMVIIILSFFFGKEELGCFSMVVQLILLPITVIGSAMANVYYRDVSIKIDDKDSVAQTTIKVARISLILSFLPLLFLACGGDKLLILFLGSKWGNVGIMSLCLAIYSLPVILTEPLLPVFRAFDKQEARLKFNIINIVLSFSSLLLFSYIMSNIYVVIIIYACLYSAIRFGILSYIYKITGISLSSVSKVALIAIIVAYLLLFARIVTQLTTL